eukprot:8856308-Prorocentrum_lima.AAC.1
MTSSLVGSEMCIRDRGNLLQSRCASHVQESPDYPVYSARNCAQGRIPVSYTHLTLPTICSV